MTREQQIAHWAPIVSIVYRAEDSIKAEWFPRLRKAKRLDKPQREALADEYVRAVAAEIVDHGGMAFEGDDNESDGLIDPYDGY